MEPSVYQVDLVKAHLITEIAEKTHTKKKRGIRESADYPKAAEAGYAVQRGALRGSHKGQSADIVETHTNDVPIDFNASDEGLYALVQTHICRRQVLRLVYDNKEAEGECTVACLMIQGTNY